MFPRRYKVIVILVLNASIIFSWGLFLRTRQASKRQEHASLSYQVFEDPGQTNKSKVEETAQKNYTRENLKPCKVDNEVRGTVFVNQSTGHNFTRLGYELAWVNPGGWWSPTYCQPSISVGIIIPFRDRYEHLLIFLRHMHPYLTRQKLRYRIYVIEQADPEQPFNRGMLMNVGFVSAAEIFGESHDCFIFHDVDLIPEDDRNEYNCPTSPRHMSVAVSTMKYKLLYGTLFGGIEAFWSDQFKFINGFPNRYWGWGAEDDDLYKRITRKGLSLTRPKSLIARYTMLKHTKQKKGEGRSSNLQISGQMHSFDGLSSLDYDVLTVEERPLYSFVSVNLHIHNFTDLLSKSSQREGK